MDQGEITRLLDRWSGGDIEAFNALVPVVYAELKSLAGYHLRNERESHTLQPTALVHEAFLRLRQVRTIKMTNRAYFYGAAAQVMRRVLVDHARRRKADKRGGPAPPRGDVTAMLDQYIDVRFDLVALSDALDALAAISPEKAKVIELRFFGGLSVEETAEFLRIAPATVKRYFAFARSWLFRALDAPNASGGV